MYFLFIATERQHSIKTGAHMAARLSAKVKVFTGSPLFISNITHNPANPHNLQSLMYSPPNLVYS